jgi:hypothetical protein
LLLFPHAIASCADDLDLGPPAKQGAEGVAGAASAGSSGMGGQGGAAGKAGAGGKPLNDCADEAACVAAGYKTPPGLGQPPLPTPGAPGPAPSAVSVQAIRVLLLGDTDPDGVTNPDAWKKYGFDLDGWSSDAKFGAHCKAVGGAKKTDIRLDGEHGIDNSFGKNLTNGFLAALWPNPTSALTMATAAGQGTTVLRIHGLALAGDQVGLTTELINVSGSKDGQDQLIAPTETQWQDGSYVWRPRGEQAGTDGGSTITLEGGYVVGDLWVSGGPATFPIVVDVKGYPLTLSLHNARMMGRLSADRRSMTEGIIGGVLDTGEAITRLHSLQGRISDTFCTGSTIGYSEPIRPASDILDDGTQDPTKDCNAISVGFGFVTAPASLGEPTPVVPGIDPCEGL